MKSAIVYKSVGGNTKLLADIIAQQLHIKAQSLITSVDVEDVELVYVGFWTDKGECDEDVKRFLKGLHHQKYFCLEQQDLVEIKVIFREFSQEFKLI